MFELAVYDRLTSTKAPAKRTLSLPELFRVFTTHTISPTKDSLPLFGPYRLFGTNPKRADRFVGEMTLAVFDADVGTEADLIECDARLTADGLARIWYSSHSYSPDKPTAAFRLILPLAHPASPRVWRSFRKDLITKYAIPAKVEKCGGLSHAYYFPSCPPGASPIAEATEGRLLVPPHGPVTIAPTRVFDDVEVDFDFPDEPTEPVDLTPYREAVRRAATAKRRKGDAPRAELLERLLDGKRLATPGNINDALTSLTGMLAFLFPHAPKSVFDRLLEPSVIATVDDVEKDAPVIFDQLVRALRKKHAALEVEALIFARTDALRHAARGPGATTPQTPAVPEIQGE